MKIEENELFREHLNDPEFKAIFGTFRDQLEIYFQEINQASESSDYRHLRDVAHKLKGSAGCFGFAALASRANLLMNAAVDPVETESIQSAARSVMFDVADLLVELKRLDPEVRH